MKEVVLIVFGGKSVEHDISIITAVQTMKKVPGQYVFLPIYIDKNNVWWSADNLKDVSIYKDFFKLAKNLRKVMLCGGLLYTEKRGKFLPTQKVSSVLNCCHGRTGEDGSLQGFFNACGVPCSSCGVTSSALCMDKIFMKDVLKANAVSSVAYGFLCDEDEIKLPKNLSLPVVVKPANLGSSIGISVCREQKEFFEAIELAFKFDKRVLIESLVENLREFNCACFQFKGQRFVSSVNEVVVNDKIYTFDEKYLKSQSNNLEPEKKLSKKIKALTERVYKIFDCQGVVRVDFLYDSKNELLYVNEINTIPGSLAVYLFKGVSTQEIISAILEEAKGNFSKKDDLISSFESDAIEIYSKYGGSCKK